MPRKRSARRAKHRRKPVKRNYTTGRTPRKLFFIFVFASGGAVIANAVKQSHIQGEQTKPDPAMLSYPARINEFS
jgi:hypothetical protein